MQLSIKSGLLNRLEPGSYLDSWLYNSSFVFRYAFSLWEFFFFFQTYSYQIVYTSYLDIIESLVTIASFSEIACEIISLSNGSP